MIDFAKQIQDYKGYILFNIEESTSKRDACIKDPTDEGEDEGCNYSGLPLSKTEFQQQLSGIQSVAVGGEVSNVYASLYENNEQIFTDSLNNVTKLKQIETSFLNSTGNTKASVFIAQGEGEEGQSYWQATVDQNGVLQNNKVTVKVEVDNKETELFYTVVYLAIYS